MGVSGRSPSHSYSFCSQSLRFSRLVHIRFSSAVWFGSADEATSTTDREHEDRADDDLMWPMEADESGRDAGKKQFGEEGRSVEESTDSESDGVLPPLSSGFRRVGSRNSLIDVPYTAAVWL